MDNEIGGQKFKWEQNTYIDSKNFSQIFSKYKGKHSDFNCRTLANIILTKKLKLISLYCNTY